jgi:dipeptidyl aminopeptidase/acylaminoacyl peptidase
MRRRTVRSLVAWFSFCATCAPGTLAQDARPFLTADDCAPLGYSDPALDCRAITYDSDGLVIDGWMVAPRHRRGPLPVLVYNRGGNGAYGALDVDDVRWQLAPYAREGFLVLASNYRGDDDARASPGDFDEFGGRDVRDVRRLLALVPRIPRADADNVFMLGVSRGGMQSYLVARDVPGIRALAVIGGMADLAGELRFRGEMETVYAHRIPGYARDKHATLASRSVLHWAEALPPTMPVLLLHGDADARVHVSNSTRLHRRLDALGHPNKLVVYAGEDHALSGRREQARAEVIAWFRAAMRVPSRAVAEAR